MKNVVLEKIKERGFWRVNFQPLVIKKIDTLKECIDLMEKSKVSLRGWDYPHIPRRNDESEGIQLYGEYIEASSNLGAHKEFWRLYKSSQFIFYRAFREDWFDEDGFYDAFKEIKPKTVLSLVSTIYEMTEAFVFLTRLIESGLYNSGVTVNISLHNLENRKLWIDDRNRSPFWHDRITGAQEKSFSKNFSKDEILTDTKEIVNKLLIELFDCFGWNPGRELILKDQEKLLSGRI